MEKPCQNRDISSYPARQRNMVISQGREEEGGGGWEWGLEI